eukprot:PRCOL_00002726-RA
MAFGGRTLLAEEARRAAGAGDDGSSGDGGTSQDGDGKDDADAYMFGDGFLALKAAPAHTIFAAFAKHTDPATGERKMTRDNFLRGCVPTFPRAPRHKADAVAPDEGPGSDASGSASAVKVRERALRSTTRNARALFDDFDLDEDGLISFDEFVLFHAMLNIPTSGGRTDVAFNMFDVDGNGVIDADEFTQAVTVLCRKRTFTWDTRHVDWKRTRFMRHHFGERLDRKITLPAFQEMLMRVHRAVMRLEFEHYDVENRGSISLRDFAESLIANAHSRDVPAYKRRLVQLPSLGLPLDSEDPQFLVSFEQFCAMAELRNERAEQLMVALNAYARDASRGLSKHDFKHALVAANPNCQGLITDVMVDVMYLIFDQNGDGQLQLSEFEPVFNRHSIHSRALYDMKSRSIEGSGIRDVVTMLACAARCAATGGRPST